MVLSSLKKGCDRLANQDIKLAAAGAGVKLWQIADALGVNDGNFSRKLRHELTAEEKAQILEIIDALSTVNREEG